MLAVFEERLPESLTFNSENMRQAELNDDTHDFIIMHLLIHSLKIVSYCPALFWTSQSDGTLVDLPQVQVSWSAARTCIDIYLSLRLMNERAFLSTSSFLIPLSIARSAFVLEKTYSEGPWASCVSGSYSYSESLNQFYLDRCQSLVAQLSTSVKRHIIAFACLISEQSLGETTTGANCFALRRIVRNSQAGSI